MADPACAMCSGFGHVPSGPAPAGWYERDWRLMLDPTVSWAPCPRCVGDRADTARLHDDLARIMMRRLAAEVGTWSRDGAWEVGVVEEFRRVYRWRQLACVCQQREPRRWLLLSEHGVTTGLDDERCRLLLAEAGAPTLSALD